MVTTCVEVKLLLTNIPFNCCTIFQNKTAYTHNKYDWANWQWHTARNQSISVFLVWLSMHTKPVSFLSLYLLDSCPRILVPLTRYASGGGEHETRKERSRGNRYLMKWDILALEPSFQSSTAALSVHCFVTAYRYNLCQMSRPSDGTNT